MLKIPNYSLLKNCKYTYKSSLVHYENGRLCDSVLIVPSYTESSQEEVIDLMRTYVQNGASDKYMSLAVNSLNSVFKDKLVEGRPEFLETLREFVKEPVFFPMPVLEVYTCNINSGYLDSLLSTADDSYVHNTLFSNPCLSKANEDLFLFSIGRNGINMSHGAAFFDFVKKSYGKFDFETILSPNSSEISLEKRLLIEKFVKLMQVPGNVKSLVDVSQDYLRQTTLAAILNITDDFDCIFSDVEYKDFIIKTSEKPVIN